MNTPPKPGTSISARCLGPIISLDGELSKRDQNLIFARNGVGKSFLSRALRYLDLHGQNKDITGAAYNLVSDESSDGCGNFTISRGSTELGQLTLQKNGDAVVAQVPDRVFHVFSEDFVQEELREKSYNPDGDIEGQIAVDSENIKLKDAQEAVTNAETTEAEANVSLRDAFNAEKVLELHEKAAVNKQLRDYKVLQFENVITQFTEKPDAPDRSFVEILKDLDSLKSIPAEPEYPDPVVSIHVDDINVGVIIDSLQKITSPSTVSETIKQKIEDHPDFFKTGFNIVTEHNANTCPFCNQSVKDQPAKSTIESYITYFKDEEERHKSELRRFSKALNNKETEITSLSPRIAHQRTSWRPRRRNWRTPRRR